jgi:hypothetical protein
VVGLTRKETFAFWHSILGGKSIQNRKTKTMKTTANITIYLQALGGKFLGPNAYKTDSIKLEITQRGKTDRITYRLGDNANDGGIGTSFLSNPTSGEGLSSYLAILTPTAATESEPAVNYLTPDSDTICGTVRVTFSERTELVYVSVLIPRPEGDDLVLTQSVALDQLQEDYRVIVVVPGLLLELPAASEMLDFSNNIYVSVKMMCGCPITTGIPNSYWAESDFLVSAEVHYRNRGSVTKDLTFASAATPSLFQAKVDDFGDLKLVNFTARQKSTGNIGYLSAPYPR